MKNDEKTVLHIGAHVASQAIAASLTKDRDDNARTGGVVIAIVIGLLLNALIASL